ncbi:MAG: hypothetical protein ACM3JC_15765, partial [Rudaea sp.]
WLMFGAIREDDNRSEDPPTPQDVAPGIARPLHHFFDPYFNRPLTVAGLELIDNDVWKAVDWAIGARDAFTDPNLKQWPRRNWFSVFDARESMFRALTLLAYDGAEYADLAAGVDAPTKQDWRQRYWATAFRALGDVLHLNQDMAQPQHTRNEPHSGKLCPTSNICPAGHTSVYEKYMNARALGAASFKSGAPFELVRDIQPRPLPLGSYPVPAFANYTDYWSTSPGTGSLAGKGLADYSNRGFFTAANNLGANPYVAPSNAWTDYTIGVVAAPNWDGTVSTDPTPVFVHYGPVADSLTGSTALNVPLTSFGMWDQFLSSKSLPAKYSLNRLNYDAMADLLLPRAVAYSAGLINYFFRGRIDIALPDEGVFALADHAPDDGFTLVRARIRNVTPPFVDAQGSAQAQDMSGGQFFAVVRYHKDRKYVPGLDTIVGIAPCEDAATIINTTRVGDSTPCRDGVEEIVVSRPVYAVSLAADEQKLVEFDFADSPIPFGMTDVVLQIVYRGELGSESDAVAVGTMDLSEPTYFTYQNASDYIHIGDHVYTRPEVDASIELLSQVQPPYCVDYQQSPPRLRPECLQPFALDLTVAFADLGKPIAQVAGLPSRRFMRIVYLTVADEGFDPPVKKKSSRTIKVVARKHGTREKAFLYQDGTCLPLDPFQIPPRHAQLSVISATEVAYHLQRLGTLRGVNGWLNVSCVCNGDDAVPGTPDDRADVMLPLTPGSDEARPYAVTIMPDYL